MVADRDSCAQYVQSSRFAFVWALDAQMVRPENARVPFALGAKLPHTGSATAASIPGRARSLEDAGFDSLWVSDHVVMPQTIGSYYPFAADGKALWTGDVPYVEAVVAMAAANG